MARFSPCSTAQRKTRREWSNSSGVNASRTNSVASRASALSGMRTPAIVSLMGTGPACRPVAQPLIALDDRRRPTADHAAGDNGAPREGDPRVDRPPRAPQSEAERIFEMSPALLAVAGFDGYLRRFNPAFAVFGYSRDELLSRPWIEFAHPDDRPRMEEAAASLESGTDVARLENRVICRDGSVRRVEWTTRIVPEEGLFYAAGRDVTDVQRAGEEQAALRRVATLVAREAAPQDVFTAVGR